MGPQPQLWIDAMASNDRQFFVALGKRIATLRREQHMTQQQLADALGVAQQTLAHYEVARLRVPASMLPTLGEIFNVPVDDLVGHVTKSRAKRGPASKLQQQVERLAQLPKPQQRIVMQMIDGVLAQAGR
jgi:transcriptional regulator with XRE-family HTH domain